MPWHAFTIDTAIKWYQCHNVSIEDKIVCDHVALLIVIIIAIPCIS